MTLCSPCSVSLSVHITDLIGECQRNICTSQRKANLFFLEKKVAEVPKSCKRLMPLDTVPIYIYICVVQSYSSNCYCIGKQMATMCLFWSIWCVVCSTAILISCFFLHRTYPHVHVDMPTIFGSMWAVFKAWLKVAFPWLFVRIPVKFHETTVNKNINVNLSIHIPSSNHYYVLL